MLSSGRRSGPNLCVAEEEFGGACHANLGTWESDFNFCKVTHWQWLYVVIVSNELVIIIIYVTGKPVFKQPAKWNDVAGFEHFPHGIRWYQQLKGDLESHQQFGGV